MFDETALTIEMSSGDSSLSGKIQTVLGCIDPRDAGICLPHEHLSMSADALGVPASARDKHLEEIPFALDNLWWIHRHPYSHKPNLQLNDHEAILQELKFFKTNGGQTIVENTTNGLLRDVKFLKVMAVASGVNILAGTGYYVASCQPPDMVRRTVEQLTTEMTSEIINGCTDTGIKCGHIGEIGCSWPLTAIERKVLQAAAITQTETGAPVIIHPGRSSEAPAEIIRVLQEAGGDISKTVMSHLDRTFHTEEDLLEFASLGSYCEYDLFGIEQSHYQLQRSVDMISDAQRIQRVKWLIEAGFEDRVLISQDIHTKHRLMKYGGHGYSHVLINIIPKMLDRGISQETINKITVTNPQHWLTFK